MRSVQQSLSYDGCSSSVATIGGAGVMTAYTMFGGGIGVEPDMTWVDGDHDSAAKEEADVIGAMVASLGALDCDTVERERRDADGKRSRVHW